jgi:putative transposase
LQVNHQLHKISKAIVEEARRTNAVIVVGKLKGMRKRIKGSRRTKRLINNFPYYRLVQYIKYKAGWIGLKVMEISEAYTSQTCHNCCKRSKNARVTQGLYRCNNCNREMNADENSARNILQRALGTLSKAGGLLTCPEPPVIRQERSDHRGTSNPLGWRGCQLVAPPVHLQHSSRLPL